MLLLTGDSKQIQDFGMNKFYIITNNEKDKNLEFTDRVVDYLGKRGGHCEVQLAGRQTAGPFHYTDPRKIPEETQCIIVLGACSKPVSLRKETCCR